MIHDDIAAFASVQKSQPSPRFTGIFIPVEVLEREDLSLLEKILLSWIDAMYSTQHGGCFASNEYLGKKLGVEANTIAKTLSHLRKLEFIEDVSFDGRTRVIRSRVNAIIENEQGKAALEKNPSRVGEKSNPGFEKNPSRVPPQLYTDDSKDYSKVIGGEDPPPPPPPLDPNRSKEKQTYGDFVRLKSSEYESLCESYGKDVVDYYIDCLNNWVPNNEPYKDYAAAIRQWHLRDKKEGKVPKVENLQTPNNKDKQIDSHKHTANLLMQRHRQAMRQAGDFLEGNDKGVRWSNSMNSFVGEIILYGDKDFMKKLSHEFVKRGYK
jgi:hypothetical protein